MPGLWGRLQVLGGHREPHLRGTPHLHLGALRGCRWGFAGAACVGFPSARPSPGFLALFSWLAGLPRVARCLVSHKYISNEIIVHEAADMLPSNHAGLKSKLGRVSLKTW